MTLVCGCLTRFDNGRVTQLRHWSLVAFAQRGSGRPFEAAQPERKGLSRK